MVKNLNLESLIGSEAGTESEYIFELLPIAFELIFLFESTVDAEAAVRD